MPGLCSFEGPTMPFGPSGASSGYFGWQGSRIRKKDQGAETMFAQSFLVLARF
jgi:hypothetical protein